MAFRSTHALTSPGTPWVDLPEQALVFAMLLSGPGNMGMTRVPLGTRPAIAATATRRSEARADKALETDFGLLATGRSRREA